MKIRLISIHINDNFCFDGIAGFDGSIAESRDIARLESLLNAGYEIVASTTVGQGGTAMGQYIIYTLAANLTLPEQLAQEQGPP